MVMMAMGCVVFRVVGLLRLKAKSFAALFRLPRTRGLRMFFFLDVQRQISASIIVHYMHSARIPRTIEK